MVRASLAFLILGGTLLAQKFESATIQPSRVFEDRARYFTSPGRLSMQNQTLKDCIRIAYGVKVAQVAGGPKWMETERFDVEAKVGRPAGDNELLAMLQALLKDRFKLDLHRETKMFPGYALLVAKSGVKIHEVEPGAGHINARIGSITGERSSMVNLAGALSEVLHVPVLDMTSVAGVFDFTLQWLPDLSRPRPSLSTEDPDPSVLPDTAGPSMFAALLEQLGLKLEARKSPLDVLVIERAEKPREQ
jgi:uncharacterized protein (TIGR03435 family)